MGSVTAPKNILKTLYCNICSCDFDPDLEGVTGHVGILPVSLCEICFNGMRDMVEQLCACEHCPNQFSDTWPWDTDP